jgi:hypothetical protein
MVNNPMLSKIELKRSLRGTVSPGFIPCHSSVTAKKIKEKAQQINRRMIPQYPIAKTFPMILNI